MDSNKRTVQKIFELDNYNYLDYLLNDLQSLLNEIRKNGVLNTL